MRHSILTLTALGLILGSAAPAAADTTERMSIAQPPLPAQGNDLSSNPGITPDGRYVVFSSKASNLVDGDTNGTLDVFIRDRIAETTERLSVRTDGSQATGDSYFPAVSANGRYVFFLSTAADLVPGDTNGVPDVFLHDRQTGVTRRMSVSARGRQVKTACFSLSISTNGRWIVFTTASPGLVRGDTNQIDDVFVRDRRNRSIVRVSVATSGTQGNGSSDSGDPSASGRYVAFQSTATNLVPGDTNGAMDIFLRDLRKGTTRRVNLSSSGAQADGDASDPSISANGRLIAFESEATNLAPPDPNGEWDIFIRDRAAGTTRLVTMAPNGDPADLGSVWPELTPDGRYIVFASEATNLVPGDTNGTDDIFLHDRVGGVTIRISVAGDGTEGDGAAYSGFPNADASVIAFRSHAKNLIPNDTNNAQDVFVRLR